MERFTGPGVATSARATWLGFGSRRAALGGVVVKRQGSGCCGFALRGLPRVRNFRCWRCAVRGVTSIIEAVCAVGVIRLTQGGIRGRGGLDKGMGRSLAPSANLRSAGDAGWGSAARVRASIIEAY